MGNQIYDRREMEKNLDKVNYWISNCDTKISFALAFSGILLGMVFTSNTIHDALSEYINSFFMLDLHGVLVVITLLTFIAFIVFLMISIWHLFKGLKGAIDSPGSNQEKLETKSLLFFKTIQERKFDTFKAELDSITEERLENDYLSQIYINSIICTNKFSNYNKGIKYLVISIILFVLLNISFLLL